MSKLINLSALTRFWGKVKTYVDNALSGKADADHTHTGFADATHSHAYDDLTGKPTIPTTVAQLTDAGDYAKKSEVNIDTATDAEIDAIFTA